MDLTSLPGVAALPDPAGRNAVLRQRAEQLESTFLAQMLGFAGLGRQESAFGGGEGGEQFASFLRQEQADLIVARGGIGLAETLFRAMGGQDGQ